MTRRGFALTMLGISGLAVGSTVFSLASGPATPLQNQDKKDKKTMGTDKKTGGEAPGDREKMEDIQKRASELKEKKEKEKKEKKEKKQKKENN